MAYGSVTIRTRPIRVAFLVDPSEPGALYRAIELSSFLWGGGYNPIIPVYKRTPGNWDSERLVKRPRPADIVSGYLDGFDPDFVVPVGACANQKHLVGNRDLIDEGALLGTFDGTAAPKYGIGLLEILKDFSKNELKYQRNDNLHIAIPQLNRTYRAFFACLFGVWTEAAQNLIASEVPDLPRIVHFKPTLSNFAEHSQPDRVYPRRLSIWSLGFCPSRDAVIFVCDAKSTLDIIDLWNLRAAGNYVLPIPIQAAKNKDIKKAAIDFIESNYQPYRHNPEMFYRTTIQCSRSLPEHIFSDFCKSLEVNNPKEKGRFKYSLQRWYPRLWDEWARENGHEGIVFPYSHEQEQRISEGETKLELRSLDPNFKLSRNFSHNARFANEFSFRFYGSKEPMAEVIPEGSRELSSALGRIGYQEWRFSKFGPTFLARNQEDLIFIDLPRAEAVMTEWFREHGWKVSLSSAGRIAAQLAKQLGGDFGTSWIAHRGVISMLRELESEAGLPWKSVIEKLKKVIKENHLYFSGDRFLEGLLDSNALRLGARIQCPICTRHNWYELDHIGYQLNCRFCLADFSPPIKNPKEIVWTYRAHGPFASSVAQGSFSVLLTLKFLKGHHDRGVTPLFSYQAKKDGQVLEADLSCLYVESTWRQSAMHVVHAECKSFNLFEERDAQRMEALGHAFPGSTLVFSTLKETLENSEIKIIQPLVLSARRKRLRGEPYNPIVVLTGIELFSRDGVGSCWQNRGGLFEQFHERHFDYANLIALADATQQLHLGMQSWRDWSEHKGKLKARKQ